MNQHLESENSNAYEFGGLTYAADTEAGQHALLEALDTAIREDLTGCVGVGVIDILQ